MILVFGGTTEGRVAVKTLDDGNEHYFYSTYGDRQLVECAHGTHIIGAMSEDVMSSFCQENGIRLIIDAAHPFAERLHSTVAIVSRRFNLPVIRLERRYEHISKPGIVWCDSYDEAISVMRTAKVGRLLALTGVKTIKRLQPFWKDTDTWFRILDRDESRKVADEAGFPMSKVIYYGKDDLSNVIDSIVPDAMITKESGDSGGFEEKIGTALAHGLNVFVVRRPALPEGFLIVDGRHGLRRAVEKLLPEFYPLHTGFTTGSCATAAAKAALTALLTRKAPESVSFRIPEGERMEMAISSVTIEDDSATATVIKDAGDDPDVTDKSEIRVRVSFSKRPGIHFIGGEGVGTVTLPGLGLPVGDPAINPVPRRMIESELAALHPDGLDVTVSLVGGTELADKTFNPRVGVVGGISIIGTTGIVRPFSHEAFVESIRREMDVAKAMNCKRIVVNSGGKSESYMKTLYPDLPQQAFIHYGNAIGDTMKIAEELRIGCLTIGLMIGKAVKLAEGHLDTHSHKITLNKTFLVHMAEVNGISSEGIKRIGNISMARELWMLLSVSDADRFFPALLRECHRHCASIYHGRLESVLVDDDGRIRYKLDHL